MGHNIPKSPNIAPLAFPLYHSRSVWSSQHFDWVGMKAQTLQRVGLLAALIAAAAVLYFGALWAAGLQLRKMLRR